MTDLSSVVHAEILRRLEESDEGELLASVELCNDVTCLHDSEHQLHFLVKMTGLPKSGFFGLTHQLRMRLEKYGELRFPLLTFMRA